jgi:hypothetical protein
MHACVACGLHDHACSILVYLYLAYVAPGMQVSVTFIQLECCLLENSYIACAYSVVQQTCGVLACNMPVHA